jgi:hypothetical protein
MSFKNTKEIRDNVQKQEESKKNRKTDDRYLTLKVEKNESVSVRGRFLPATEQEDPTAIPTFYATKMYHQVENDLGEKMFEQCPKSVGLDCPICKYNSVHWKTYSKKEQGRSKKTKYIANFLVLKDPKNPANEGKVFLLSFGKKIYEKIMAEMFPTSDGVDEATACDIYDVMNGKDFILKVKIVDEFMNYDDSKFSDKITALYDGDEKKLGEVAKACHKLSELVSKKEDFKSFEDIKTRFTNFIGAVNSNDVSTSKTFDSANAGVTSLVEQATSTGPEDTWFD